MVGTDHGKSNRAECSQLTESGHLDLFNKLVRTLMYWSVSIGETCELDMAGVKRCHVTGTCGIQRSHHNQFSSRDWVSSE